MTEPAAIPSENEAGGTGYDFAKRVFDLALAIALIPPTAILMAAVAIAVKLTSNGPVLYVSERVGRHKRHFYMSKVRTMRIDTPAVATHLMKEPDKHLTPIGGFLRRLSLDEMPQLWDIIRGEMSFVGPRPALFNQDDLVALREENGINALMPGLTGWAQVNGRDDLPIPDKVELEVYYKEHRGFWFDIRIIWLTFGSVLRSQGVKH